MHVEEAKDFGFGEAERVNDRAGLEWRIGGKLDDHFRADGPLVARELFGHAEVTVESAPNLTHRAIANHGEPRVNIHTGLAVLIGKANADDGVVVDERLGNRHGRPDLDQARGHELLADPLIELADGEN